MSTLRATLRLLSAAIVSASTLTAVAQKTIKVPADQPTIQAGIDAAARGDTVLVSPGTYYESVTISKSLKLTSSGGAAVTTISAPGSAPALTLSEVDWFLDVSNFTITATAGSPKVGGAGIVLKGFPDIHDNIITGTHCAGIVSLGASTPHIYANHIDHVLANDYQCDSYGPVGGSAIYLNNSQLAPFVVPARIDGNVIEDNTEIALAQGNKTLSGTQAAGAVNVTYATAIIRDNIIRNNSAGIAPDGKIYWASAGGIHASLSPLTSTSAVNKIDIFQNLIYNNTATSFAGGVYIAASSSDPSELVFANNVLENNYSNPASGPSNLPWHSQQLMADGRMVIANNIFYDTSSGPAVICGFRNQADAHIPPSTFEHNITYSPNGRGQLGCFPDQSNAFGNMSVDPLFVNVAAKNFHLLPASPAIDAGIVSAISASTTTMWSFAWNEDFDGRPRVQIARVRTIPVVDIGAFEAFGPPQSSVTYVLIWSSPLYVDPGADHDIKVRVVSSAGPFAGTANIYRDGTFVGAATFDVYGYATLHNPPLKPGFNAFYGTFDGQGRYDPGQSLHTYISTPLATTTLSVASSLNPSASVQNVMFTVFNSPADPSINAIRLLDGSTLLATLAPDSTGKSNFTTNALTKGSHTITAVFDGNATYAPTTSAVLTQIVTGPPTTISVTATGTYALNPFTFTAQVSASKSTPAITGTVTFKDGITILGTGTLDATGRATITASLANSGIHSITATYNGDTTYEASTSPVTNVTVLANPTQVAASILPTPHYAYQAQAFAAKVTTNTTTTSPAGTATFSIPVNTPAIVNLDAAGSASTPVSLPAGTYDFAVNYIPANSSFARSTANVFGIPFIADDTTLSLSASAANIIQHQNVTLTSTITPAHSTHQVADSITFTEGGTTLGSAAIDAANRASLPLASLNPGTHVITAVYTATADFNASISNTVTVVVAPQDFTIATDPTAITVQAEHHKTLTVTLTSTGSLVDTIDLGCANLPAWTTCTFSQPAVSLSAGLTVGSSFILDTDALPRFKSEAATSRSNLVYAALLPLALIGLMRRRKLGVLIAIFLSATVITLSGCSSKYPPYTPPGTYTLQVVGTGRTSHITHTTNITLIVTEP